MLLSIITPCLNRFLFVREAVESVLAQNYSSVEHIVVDGGSTDGTLDVLSDYGRIKLISEPDKGVYDALNKGIHLAKGEVIGLLNSDDFYAENIFGEVINLFLKDPKLEAVFGGAKVFEENSDGSRTIIADYSSPDLIALSIDNVTVGNPIINARFFTKKVYQRIGLYNLCYRISSDRDFLLRVAMANIKSAIIDRIVYYYRQHSGSLTFNPASPTITERYLEYLEMSESYLKAPTISRTLAKKLKFWHSRVAMDVALRAMKKGDFCRAVGHGIRGWRYDHSWPVAFSLFLLRRATRKAIKKMVSEA